MKKALFFVVIFIGCIFLGHLYFKHVLFIEILEDKAYKYREEKGLIFSYESASISGLSTLNFTKVRLFEIGKPQFFGCDSLVVEPDIWSFIRRKFRVDAIKVANGSVNFIKAGELTNYNFLQKKSGSENSDSVSSGYSERINRLIEFAFYQVPKEVRIENFKLNYQTDSLKITVLSKSLTYKDQSIQGSFNFTHPDTSTIFFSGTLNPAANKADLKMWQPQGQSYPFVKSKFKLQVLADTVFFRLSDKEFTDEALTLKGNIKTSNCTINHWRISSEDVVINNGNLDFQIIITPNKFILDSSSVATLNKIPINSFIEMKPGQKGSIRTRVRFDQVPSTDFFASLPTGLFNSLKGLEAAGTVSLHNSFYYPFGKPDSIVFLCDFKSKDFKITKFGEDDFRKANGEFSYTAYEKEKPVRTFAVGYSNPNFTPLSGISEYLKNAVLTSEDGSFFWHKGFNAEAFKESIITNIKEKRFVRGGSTISMQLVKNLFLTRKKTVSRKIEEALIVWLIENNRLISKDRMFEIYLNIIEWAPGIYGIGEASKFYFNKTPDKLTIEESIYLAMIIPRPKGFKWNFDETGHLKEHTKDYFRLIAYHLVKRGVITEEESLKVDPANVELKGSVVNLLKPTEHEFEFQEELPEEPEVF